MQKAERSGKVIKCYCKSLIVLMMLAPSLYGQTKDTAPLVDPGPPVSTLIAVLTSSLESRSATAGQEFTLRTISDVVVDGQLVIPKGSRVLGHVTEAVTKGKDQPQSELWLVIEKAVRRDGSEVPLQGIIAALAAPQNNSLADDPTYGMLHSNEPAQSGAGVSGAASSGVMPASSKASSTASVATANLKGVMDKRPVLDENSQGAIGYENLSLEWHLIVPPPITVITSKGKNVKLQSGTQMLLRMAPPRTPR
jgi:uncharacterized coiled-coil protein SlyX